MFLITSIITAELYLSLGYFYYKKYQLNNLYGPSQIFLIILQFIGIISIGANYFINISSNLNETYLFFMDNKKIFFFGYLISAFFGLCLFITTIVIVFRKRKIEIYNVLNEAKN